MALKHLEHGVASPFLVSTRLGLWYFGADVGLFPKYAPRPHTSPHLDAHRAQLKYIGTQVAEYGTPKSLGPFIYGVTGYAIQRSTVTYFSLCFFKGMEMSRRASSPYYQSFQSSTSAQMTCPRLSAIQVIFLPS